MEKSVGRGHHEFTNARTVTDKEPPAGTQASKHTNMERTWFSLCPERKGRRRERGNCREKWWHSPMPPNGAFSSSSFFGSDFRDIFVFNLIFVSRSIYIPHRAIRGGDLLLLLPHRRSPYQPEPSPRKRDLACQRPPARATPPPPPPSPPKLKKRVSPPFSFRGHILSTVPPSRSTKQLSDSRPFPSQM